MKVVMQFTSGNPIFGSKNTYRVDSPIFSSQSEILDIRIDYHIVEFSLTFQIR